MLHSAEFFYSISKRTYSIAMLCAYMLVWGCKPSPKDIPMVMHPYYSPEKKEELKMQHEYMKYSVKSLSIYHQHCERKEEVASTPIQTQNFNENGQVIAEYIYSSKKLKTKKEFLYDSLGNKVSVKHYNAQDELRKVQEYDANGYLKLTLLYDSRNKEWLKYRNDLSYDENGYIQSIESYDPREELSGKSLYTYSAPSILKEKQQFHYKPGREEVFIQHSFFNEQGDIEKIIYSSLDTTVITVQNHYNEDQLLLHSQYRDERGLVTEESVFSYSPDSQTRQEGIHHSFDTKADTLSKRIERYTSLGKLEEFIHYESSYEEGKTPTVYEQYLYTNKGLLKNKEAFRDSKVHICEKYVYAFY